MIERAIRMTRRTISVATNGSTPLKIVVKLTSLTTLLMTKAFIPTGGWISPSSTVMTMLTPNQPIEAERCNDRKDDRHGRDDHRHRVHRAAEHEVHQHDERRHAVAADAEAGEELSELLRRPRELVIELFREPGMRGEMRH